MVFPLALMVLKEAFMGITGLLIIRRTGSVFGADWHGKAATVLLYAAMILHVFWYQIPKTVSDVLIGACAVMILISFVLYARHNVRMLKEQKKDGR